jgi:hypothetical protein
VTEPVIHRDELVGLLFTVNDIAKSLARIEELLRGDDGLEEPDEG